ncbi:MAG: hypothetical protein R6U70_03360 [Bacillota bacterium]
MLTEVAGERMAAVAALNEMIPVRSGKILRQHEQLIQGPKARRQAAAPG